MPTFSVMPTFSPEDIDIDVNDFLSECDSDEISELIEALEEDGHLSDHGYQKIKTTSEDARGIAADEFYNAIRALSNNYHNMSTETTDLIVSLAKKFI